MCKLLCGTLVDLFVFYPQGENVHVHTESHIRVYIYILLNSVVSVGLVDNLLIFNAFHKAICDQSGSCLV